MAEGKYKKWLTEDGLLLLEAWARDGLTDEQIAKNCGISRKTIYEWKREHSDIRDALSRGKEVVDVEVENALHKRATGYTVELAKNFKVRCVEYDENGKKIREYEELVVGYDEMHIPADTQAQKFWLSNRKPEAWKEKRLPYEEPEPQNDGFIDALNKSAAEVWGDGNNSGDVPV